MCRNAAWIGQFQGMCSKRRADIGVLSCGDSYVVIPA
jgi:hypothetical protein